MANTDTSIVLYGYWRSSTSYRVRIALNLKNVQYKYVAVNLKEGGQHNAQYANQLNPMQQVPTLVIDGHALTQSVAIIEYLEESRRFSGHRLLSSDPKMRAKARRIVEIINSGIHPVQNLAVLKKVVQIRKNYETFDDAQKFKYMSQWARETIAKGFDALEKVLEIENEGKGFKYCLGDNSVTMADIFLVPQVYNAVRHGVDMSKYPNIARINENCLKLQAFIDAHPDQQIDAIKPSKL